MCLLAITVVLALAEPRADRTTRISLEHYQGTQSAAVQAHGCGTTSDELCDVCIQFAVKAINVLLNIILGECKTACMLIGLPGPYMISCSMISVAGHRIEKKLSEYWALNLQEHV